MHTFHMYLSLFTVAMYVNNSWQEVKQDTSNSKVMHFSFFLLAFFFFEVQDLQAISP